MQTECPAIKLQQFLMGCPLAFEAIVDIYGKRIFALSFKLLRDEEDARDAAQETFIKIWNKRHTFHQTMKFSTWIYAIASHECYDRLRKQKVRNRSVHEEVCLKIPSHEDQENDFINKELAQLINAYTCNLTAKQRLVFTLRDIEGLEITEIVTITGLTPAKIKSNLYLARQTVRQMLEKL
jgi:RNA polymerase sigma-70 factor (ECF subfamily)